MPNLIDYHIGRLRDKNPQVRIKSAQELALIGNEAALKALEELFRTETDPGVKQAVKEAGRAIFERLKQEKEKG